MDVFSHFALPFVAVYALTRKRRLALAAGVGGFAPDLDAVTALLSLAPPLYWLGHRGASHSLLGAPLYGLGAVLLLRARFWRRVLPVAEAARFGPRHALVAVAFSYTHLALDWTTMWGVPLLWPWSMARFSADWFFYSAPLMILPSGYLAWRVARATDTRRVVLSCGALLVAAMLLSGATRAFTRPDVDAERTQPNAGEWAWTTLRPTDDGYEATFWSWGRVVGNATYFGSQPRDERAMAALELARTHVEYRAFHLYAGGPEVVQVAAREGGGHNVTFIDLMVQAQVDRSKWLPFAEDRARLKLQVVDGRVSERE